MADPGAKGNSNIRLDRAESGPSAFELQGGKADVNQVMV